MVDYDFIRQVIADRVARGHIELQETLCDDLLAAMLDNHIHWGNALGVDVRRIDYSDPSSLTTGLAGAVAVLGDQHEPLAHRADPGHRGVAGERAGHGGR